MKCKSRTILFLLLAAAMTIFYALIYHSFPENKDNDILSASERKLRISNQPQRKVLKRHKRIIQRETLITPKNKHRSDPIQHPSHVSTNQENSSELCSFILDKNSVEKARGKIYSLMSEDGHGFLFYIHLDLPSINQLTDNSSFRGDDSEFQAENDLLEWQVVKKSEKYLVQLPVDFDLVTFELLKLDKEEGDVDILIHVNNSNCVINADNKQVTIESIQNLLWTELLANFTKYSLCNRYFEHNTYRITLYYLTTIWLGYDLKCTTYTKQNKVFEAKKDELSNVEPLLCFFLANQFVWLFIIVEIATKQNSRFFCLAKSGRDEEHIKLSNSVDEDNSKQNRNGDIEMINFKEKDDNKPNRKTCIDTCTSNLDDEKTDEDYSTKNGSVDIDYDYKKGDRPYGLLRILFKFFNPKWSEFHCKCGEVFNCVFDLISKCGYNTPAFRLLLILEIFIILPFGLYRTLYRKTMTDKIYKEYRHVVRTSEPIFTIISNDETALILDVVYATLIPLIGIFICTGLYNCYTRTSSSSTFKKSIGISNRLIEHFKAIQCICAKLGLFFVGIVFTILRLLTCCLCNRKKYSSQRHPNVKKCCKRESYGCFKCHKCCKCKKLEGCDCKEVFLRILYVCEIVVLGMMFDYIYILKMICYVLCVVTCTVFDFVKQTFSLVWHLINCIFPIVSLISHSVNCLKPSNCELVTSHRFLRYITRACHWFLFGLFFVFYCALCLAFLRPMITTFTFLLRSITYVLFVAMPVRINLFRYLVIFGTTLAYIHGYYVEIVNMFSEILSSVFELQEKYRNTDSGNDRPSTGSGENSEENHTVREELMTFILNELVFVQKRIYYFILKCVVVVRYLTITVESLLISGRTMSDDSLKHIVELTLIIISPYAISLFLKSNGSYITTENDEEIESAYLKYMYTASRKRASGDNESFLVNTEETEDLPTCSYKACSSSSTTVKERETKLDMEDSNTGDSSEEIRLLKKEKKSYRSMGSVSKKDTSF